MSRTDVRLSQLLRVYLDGVPLDLPVPCFPGPPRFRPSLLLHLHLHARTQRALAGRSEKLKPHSVSRRSLLALIHSLESAVHGLHWQGGTEWIDYYENNNNYVPSAQARKSHGSELPRTGRNPHSVWDLGANTGGPLSPADVRGELPRSHLTSTRLALRITTWRVFARMRPPAAIGPRLDQP